MPVSERGRFIFLWLSVIVSLIATTIIVAALFSVSFRYVRIDEMRGTKFYGLFRFCYEPDGEEIRYAVDHLNEYSCHLRRRSPGVEPIDLRQYYSDFELSALLLLALAVVVSAGSIAFAVCTLHSPIFSLAHSVLLLISAISSIAAFLTYTYYNELKDNQNENTHGVLYPYKYGWAYYYTGGAAALFLLASLFAVIASTFFFIHRKKKESKRHSLYL